MIVKIDELDKFEDLGEFTGREREKGNKLIIFWLLFPHLASLLVVTPLTYCSWLSLLSASRSRFHFRILHATFGARPVILCCSTSVKERDRAKNGGI